ncbi:MAG: cation transporter [Candidatus Magnetomorum sp.]|nr:cation transporter [Candidatus Magnetomorum sp.]
MRYKKCEICLERVALVGVLVNLVMVILKIIIGITSGSKACIADGLHSASNIITAFAITVSQKISQKKKSKQYHYGYGKIEFLAAAFVSLLITLGALLLISLSIKHLLNEPSAPPHFSAVLMAIISIGTNEMLFRYMRCVGTQFKSQSILANAWANRADCFSSIAVIVGVIGARFGLHHLDPVAALVVVAIIIKVSITILVDSIKALMDNSVNHIYGEDIQSLVASVENVLGISAIKTRHIGQKIWAEVNISVEPECSLAEAQRVADNVKSLLIDRILDLERVTVNCLPVEHER